MGFAKQEPIFGIGEIARDLDHPRAVRLGTDAGDFDARSAELHDEVDVVPDQSTDGEDLHSEKITRRNGAPVCSENCFQERLRLRVGAGSMPCSARVTWTVVLPISTP